MSASIQLVLVFTAHRFRLSIQCLAVQRDQSSVIAKAAVVNSFGIINICLFAASWNYDVLHPEHAANATIAMPIVKVTYSITLFQNLFCIPVISCANIAIFFFSLSPLSSIYCIVLLRAAVYSAMLCSCYWSSSC
jgi:hypothetical protein